MATCAKQCKERFAKESIKTKRAREKLKKKLEAFDLALTPHALEQKRIEIHRWIALHAPSRVVLRKKEISLFDENQNTAKLSARVQGIADKIRQWAASECTDLKERTVTHKT